MTNTYENDSPVLEKIAEELRLIRCCLERWILVHGDYGDYQQEKFFGAKNISKDLYVTKTTSGACLIDRHTECCIKNCQCFCHEKIP